MMKTIAIKKLHKLNENLYSRNLTLLSLKLNLHSPKAIPLIEQVWMFQNESENLIQIHKIFN